MRRDGWCIWSPWSGYLTTTFERTRSESIKAFEMDIDFPWRKYRAQGYECRPVRLVTTALDDAMAREEVDRG